MSPDRLNALLECEGIANGFKEWLANIEYDLNAMHNEVDALRDNLIRLREEAEVEEADEFARENDDEEQTDNDEDWPDNAGE